MSTASLFSLALPFPLRPVPCPSSDTGPLYRPCAVRRDGGDYFSLACQVYDSVSLALTVLSMLSNTKGGHIVFMEHMNGSGGEVK